MVMKYLRFNFCHPVKVHANLIRLSTPKPESHSIIIESKENLIEIPLSNYSEGKWKIILDWEYENQNFTHQKEFEIKNQEVV